jgi:Protein of unknown function (DUF3164)
MSIQVAYDESNTEEAVVPKGYRRDAVGHLIPLRLIKPVDLKRDEVVVDLCLLAKEAQAQLVAFKLLSIDAFNAFVAESLAEYEVKLGGKKGNITLVSFDGKFKAQRQMQETVVFDERLQAAKLLIDECINLWSKGSNEHIKVLVNSAFRVDSEGMVSTARVIGLRRLEIKDEKWQRAMNAIADSMRVASTKSYMRFYERDDAGEYMPISLDVAAI